jgi:hypothetical protein
MVSQACAIAVRGWGGSGQGHKSAAAIGAHVVEVADTIGAEGTLAAYTRFGAVRR